MANITTNRAGQSVSWCLQLAGRSRTIAFSFSTSSNSRRHRSHSLRQHRSRLFSTNCSHFADTATTSTAPKQSAPRASTSYASKSHEPLPPTERTFAANPKQEPLTVITSSGLSDQAPAPLKEGYPDQVDWTRSFHGLSTEAFSQQTQDILLAPLNTDDIEIKPDGILYLPEIKYRRILNKAFGPGGWGLAPRGETIVTAKAVTREYALLCNGRLVSTARGEQDYFDTDGIPTATEGCKSNALMRCCKDLGIASELWDPRFLKKYIKANAREIWVEHAVTKKRKKITMRKDDEVKYPFKEAPATPASGRFN